MHLRCIYKLTNLINYNLIIYDLTSTLHPTAWSNIWCHTFNLAIATLNSSSKKRVAISQVGSKWQFN